MKYLPLLDQLRGVICLLPQIIFVGGRSFWNNQKTQKIVSVGIKGLEIISYVVYKLS